MHKTNNSIYYLFIYLYCHCIPQNCGHGLGPSFSSVSLSGARHCIKQKKPQNLSLRMIDSRDSNCFLMRKYQNDGTPVISWSVVSVLGYQHLLSLSFSFIKLHNKRRIRGEIVTTENWLWRTVWHCFRRAA